MASKSATTTSDASTRCLVYCRLRPNKPNEFTEKGVFPLLHLTPRSVGVKDEKTYDFDGTFGGQSTQEELFQAIAKPSVDHALNGFRAAIMCYGQTGTGKSFTMCNVKTGQEGLVPRSANYLFNSIAADPTRSYQVEGQFIQIYRDHLGDLMGAETGLEQVGIFFDKEQGVTLPGCSSHVLRTSEEFISLFNTGYARRVTTATAMNPESSRGHAALVVWVSSKRLDDPSSAERVGKITFIDLAGYERFSKTGISNNNAIMKDEAKCINASLLSLGHVVTSLSNGDKHVPWRNAKLTRLLQDSIGGRSRTTIVLTVGPSSDHLFETTNTLQFGMRAMAVKVTAKATEIVDFEKLSARLQAQLAAKDERISALELQLASHAVVHEDLQSRHTRDLDQLKTRHEEELEELRRAGATAERIISMTHQQEVETENIISQQREELEYHAEAQQRDCVEAAVEDGDLERTAALRQARVEVESLREQLKWYAARHPDEKPPTPEAPPYDPIGEDDALHLMPRSLEEAVAQISGLKAIRAELERQVMNAARVMGGGSAEGAEVDAMAHMKQAEIDAQQQTIATLQAQVSTLQSQLAAASPVGGHASESGAPPNVSFDGAPPVTARTRARRGTSVGESIERISLQNDLLRQQLEATSESNRMLASQVAELREQLVTERREAAAIHQQLTQAAAEHAAKSSSSAGEDVAATSAEVADLKTKIELLLAEKNRISEELNVTRAQLRTRTLIGEQHQETLETTIAEAETTQRGLRAEVAKAQADAAKLRVMLDDEKMKGLEAQAELDIVRGENTAYIAKISELASLQTVVKDLKSQLEVSQRSHAAALDGCARAHDQQIAKVTSERRTDQEAAARQLQQTRQDAEADMQTASKTVAELKQANEALATNHRTQVDELRQRVDQSRAELLVAQEALAVAQSTIDSTAMRSLEASESAAYEKTSAQVAIKAIQDQSATTIRGLQIAQRQELDAMESKLSRLQGESRDAAASTATKLQVLESQLRESTQRAHDLTRQLQQSNEAKDAAAERLARLSNVDACAALANELRREAGAEVGRLQDQLVQLSAPLGDDGPHDAGGTPSGEVGDDGRQRSAAARSVVPTFLRVLQEERGKRSRMEVLGISYAAHLTRALSLLADVDPSVVGSTNVSPSAYLEPVADIVTLLNDRDADLARKDDLLAGLAIQLEAAKLAAASVAAGKSVSTMQQQVAQSAHEDDGGSSLRSPNDERPHVASEETETLAFVREKAATLETHLRQRVQEFNVMKVERDLALSRLADASRGGQPSANMEAAAQIHHDAVIVADTSDLQVIIDCKEAEMRILAHRLDQRERSLAAVTQELMALRRRVTELHEKFLAVEIKGSSAGSSAQRAGSASRITSPDRAKPTAATGQPASPSPAVPTPAHVDVTALVGADAARHQLDGLLQLVRQLRKQNTVLHGVICDRSVALRYLAWMLATRRLLPANMDPGSIGGDLSRELRLAFAERDAELKIKDQVLLQRSTEVLVLEQNLLDLFQQIKGLGHEPVRPLTAFSKTTMEATRAAQQEVITRTQSRAYLHEQHAALQGECSEVETQVRMIEAQLKSVPPDAATANGLRQELITARLRKEELLGTLSVLDAQCSAHDQEVELLRQVLSQSTRMIATLHQEKEIETSYGLMDRIKRSFFGGGGTSSK